MAHIKSKYLDFCKFHIHSADSKKHQKYWKLTLSSILLAIKFKKKLFH